MKRGLLLAGDLSGAVALRDVIREVRGRGLNWKFVGSGTPITEGDMEVIADVGDISVTGFTEMRHKWRNIRRFYKEVKRIIERGEVDFVLLVDYPGFNMMVGEIAKRHGIPVFYYIPPQVWAWKPERARTISDFSTFIFVVFPFEKVWFEKYGGRVEYVGNPVLWRIKRRGYKRKDGNFVVLMPGSRANEFRAHYGILKEVIKILGRDFPEIHCRIVLAETIRNEGVEFAVRGDSLEYLSEAKLAVCASGTAVLESFLLGVPTIVIYRTSYFTYFLGKLFANVRYLSIPNIIFNRRILPEFIQSDCNPYAIASEAKRILKSDCVWMDTYVQRLRDYLDTDLPPERKVVDEIEKWI